MSLFTTRTRSAGAVAALAALALGLSACTITVDTKKDPAPVESSSSTPSQTPEETPSTESSPSDTPSETPSETSAAPAADPKGGPSVEQMTPAGTNLKIGQTGKIFVQTGKPGKDYYDKQLFDVKVTSIEKGSFADLAGLKNSDKYKGYVPYYIHSEVTLKQTLNPIKTSVSWTHTSFKGTLAGGSPAGSLIIFGGFDKCPYSKSFRAIGDTQVDCQIALAPTGTAVTGVSYTGNSSNYLSYDLNPYRDKPLVWTK